MAMTRRTTGKKSVPVVAAAPEPETTLCDFKETVITKRERVLCTDCNFHEEWRDGLCFTHWKESQGFVFDETKKVFVKK
jgi:hypothetical protein